MLSNLYFFYLNFDHIPAGYHKCESTFQIKPTFAEKSLKSPYLNVPTELRYGLLLGSVFPLIRLVYAVSENEYRTPT